MSSQFNQSQMLVHDFAIAGHVVQGVEQQVNNGFLPNAGTHPDWAPWKSNDSIFCIPFHWNELLIPVTFVGINDVSANLDISVQISLYFTLQASLYNTGARNFVFYQVPPFDRSPVGTSPPFPFTPLLTWLQESKIGFQQVASPTGTPNSFLMPENSRTPSQAPPS